jgi:hypothetical protein
VAAREDRLRERIARIISGKSTAPRATAAFAAPSLDEAAPEAQPPAVARRPFSNFVPEDVAEAVELASKMMRVARDEHDHVAGIDAAVSLAEHQESTSEVAGLTQHAVKLYLLHDDTARHFFPLPPLEIRQARAVLPSTTRGAIAAAVVPYGGKATSPEDRVSFFREDPLLNEHHEHWHLVYPTAGQPATYGGYRLGNRHGELFAYMHEQMLARYDAERLAVGLQPVEPFVTTDYAQPIPQGYDPGALALWTGDNWYQFGSRPAGMVWSDLTVYFPKGRPGALIADQVRYFDLLWYAATTGFWPYGRPVTLDDLGNTEEANVNSVDFYATGSGWTDHRNWALLGNHHNDGHLHYACFANAEPFGVMYTTATACRDPIFFRWHRHVDSLFRQWQDQQQPYDFNLNRPPVIVSKGASERPFTTEAVPPDVLLSGKTTKRFELTSQLTTEMLSRPIELQDVAEHPVVVEVDYLSHDDFAYIIPIESTSDSPASVTMRLFIAPEEQIDDRQAWIEMDKFVVSLGPKESAVVMRASDQSSVVRKPALRPRDLTPKDEPNPLTDASPWCDCGWPYTLLLPRGTNAGAEYRLFAMLSAGSDLSVNEHEDECTSVSYCGVKDDVYPDKRDMGYPFARPLDGSFQELVRKNPNMHSWRFTIRCKTPLP